MRHRAIHTQRGLSLIELMVAMVIGLILILGVIQVFGASRSAYQLSEGMARSQENGRFAIDYLQRDLRMAGHFGCVNDQSHLQTPGSMQTHFAAGASEAVDFAVSVQGYEATGTDPGAQVTIGGAATGWSPELPAAITNLAPLPGSDIIVVRALFHEGAPVDAITAGTGTTFTVPVARWGSLTADGVASPTLFGIADCSYVDIFPATAVSASTGEVTTSATIDRYTAQPSGQTVLYRAESLVYYVANNPVGQPALYRARFDGSNYIAEEMVEGVESMQLLYGLDRVTDLTAAQPSGYIDDTETAEEIGADANEWRRVGAVQVGLIMRSPDAAGAPKPGSATTHVRALGVEFVPPDTYDMRYRASYEANIAVRNRLYGN